MNRVIKRPDVAIRNRLLKTRVFGSKKCESCLKEMPIRAFKKKRQQNKRFCTKTCYWASKVGKDGVLSTNWQGGKTEEGKIIRSSRSYAEWRLAVFTRDGFACVNCGDDCGGNLQADHVKQFAYYPELRLDINNGRTLCEPCHRETPTWGNNNKVYATA